MTYGSTMFGKLWEWIMGIIAWIMSKFTRISVGGASDSKEEPAQAQEQQEQEQESEHPPQPTPASE